MGHSVAFASHFYVTKKVRYMDYNSRQMSNMMVTSSLIKSRNEA